MKNLLIILSVILLFHVSCDKEDLITPEKQEINLKSRLKSADSTEFGSWDVNCFAPYSYTLIKMLGCDYDNNGSEDFMYLYGESLWINTTSICYFPDDDEVDFFPIFNSYYVADFDTDRKDDIVRINSSGTLYYNYASDSFDESSTDWDGHLSGYGDPSVNEFNFADLDGDGKDDIIKVGQDGKIWIDYSNQGGYGSWNWDHTGYGDCRKNTFLCNDMDGDGKADIVKVDEDGKFRIDYADEGDGFGSWDETHTGYGDCTKATFVTADFDGDGKFDLGKLDSDGKFRIDYADGSGFGSWDETHSGYGPYSTRTVLCADLDGDDMADFCTWCGVSPDPRYIRIDYADE